jgi:hypothetical protein
MIEQPVFTLTDDDGEAMTAAQAEARMCSMFLDPQQVERLLPRFIEVDRGLASLAVVVNPALRDRLWPTLDDQQKFWVVLYESGPVDRVALVKRVVGDVVRELYHDPLEGMRDDNT